MIKTLPYAYPEIGRVRLGERVVKNGREFPSTRRDLRFTSNDEVALKAIASQLGGEVKEWAKGEQTYELLSESSEVECFLPPDPIETSYELWGSGGCQRRCDGERCTVPVMNDDGGYLEERPCECVAEGRTPGDKDDKGACNATVRIRLVLPHVPGIGIWLCTSHSVYAAMELPGQVALLEGLRQSGQLVPAVFAIDQRSEKKPWEKYKRDYIVPVLRIRASLHQLAGGRDMNALVSGTTSIAPEPTALTPPAPVTPEVVDKAPPTAKTAGDGGGVFQRSVLTAGTRAGLEGAELDAMVAFATDKEVLADLTEPDEGNAVLAALRRFSNDELFLLYSQEDATPYISETQGGTT